MARGGKRAGSGRKPIAGGDAARINVRLNAACFEALDRPGSGKRWPTAREAVEDALNFIAPAASLRVDRTLIDNTDGARNFILGLPLAVRERIEATLKERPELAGMSISGFFRLAILRLDQPAVCRRSFKPSKGVPE